MLNYPINSRVDEIIFHDTQIDRNVCVKLTCHASGVVWISPRLVVFIKSRHPACPTIVGEGKPKTQTSSSRIRICLAECIFYTTSASIDYRINKNSKLSLFKIRDRSFGGNSFYIYAMGRENFLAQSKKEFFLFFFKFSLSRFERVK